MMGSRRTNANEEPPTSINLPIQANSIAPNIQPARSDFFQEGSISPGDFDFFLDTPLLNSPDWDNIHSMNHPITQEIPETSGNPFLTSTSFQNPQFNLNSSSTNTEVPSLHEWDFRWNPQHINQEHNAISIGMNNQIGISNFDNPFSSKNPTIPRNFNGDLQINNRQVNRDLVLSPLQYRPRDTVPIQTQNNVNFNTNQFGVQGKVEGSFLSLGIGGTKEAVPTSQEMSNKLKEAALTQSKLAHARKAMGQSLDGFSPFSNQMSHLNSTPNSGLVSSPYHILEMQQNDMQLGTSRHDANNSNILSGRNVNHGNLNHQRGFVSNQGVNSVTVGGNLPQFMNSQQCGFNRVASEASRQVQNIRFKTANSLPIPSESSMTSPSIGLGSSSTRQNYAVKHSLPQNHMATQGHFGGGFSQRTAVPQVSWVNSGQPVTDLPFSKRLGVEFNGTNVPQAAERHFAPRGTNFQTTTTGQMCKFPDRVSTRPPDNILRPPIDHGAPVNHLLNSQQPFPTHGQPLTPVQLANNPRPPPPPPTSVNSPSQFHVRPYHKRTAAAPPPSPHWVQRQKMTHQHPPIHQHPTKPVIPSMPVPQSQTHRARPLTDVRPHVPVTTAPVYHITREDQETTPELTNYKCLLCKRDLALTSEGAVYQPTAPPPVAVLPCGHTFHDQCLEKITPPDQAKDPPCIPCAIGEN